MNHDARSRTVPAPAARRPGAVIAAAAAAAAILLTLAAPSTAEPASGDWPQFRGPGATGVAPGPPPPVTWDGESGANVLWRTPIPGLAHSSPVIWGDRVFVTTAVDEEGGEADLRVGLFGDIDPVHDEQRPHAFRVLALDKRTGAVLWQHTAHRGVPAVKRHTKSTHANPTPATDGKVLVVSFGSAGLHAYDLDGKPLWQKDLGVLDAGYYQAPAAQWGYGSSPVIADGRVIVQADVLGESFLAAFDAATGRELWRTKREDVPTWSTPAVFRHDGTSQVIVNGHRHVGGYDLATGKEVWRLASPADIPVPTPFASGELVFFSSAHGGYSPFYAVRPAVARGTLELTGRSDEGEGTAVAWSRDRGGSYLPTPIVVGDLLYVGRDNGVLGCYEAATGRRVFQTRLSTGTGGFTSSAVAAGDRIYYTGEDGTTRVVRAGDEFELLATNSIGETVLSTPAISDGVLFFRTRGHLVAVGEKGGAAAEPAPEDRESP